ncbi:Aste57867_1789 [Aphanomyces stellatus]|uniref:Aste57867_1789 protein n=1 Tax=Aphanomyces stellatus TaxID=120398 RepID=A0A485K6J9_9STRA|nr:hypothetical protein As57867_001787 [Aphanomyces stellatus]VFT78998.1 Aste57867_1789 [Aphanomyces stellatus]
MKYTTALVVAAVAASSVSAQWNSCEDNMKLLSKNASDAANPYVIACTAAAGFPFSNATNITDAQFDKFVQAPACAAWYTATVVTPIRQMSPPCMVVSLFSMKSGLQSTRDFDVDFVDYSLWMQYQSKRDGLNLTKTTKAPTTWAPRPSAMPATTGMPNVPSSATALISPLVALAVMAGATLA